LFTSGEPCYLTIEVGWLLTLRHQYTVAIYNFFHVDAFLVPVGDGVHATPYAIETQLSHVCDSQHAFALFGHSSNRWSLDFRSESAESLSLQWWLSHSSESNMLIKFAIPPPQVWGESFRHIEVKSSYWDSPISFSYRNIHLIVFVYLENWKHSQELNPPPRRNLSLHLRYLFNFKVPELVNTGNKEAALIDDAQVQR